MLLDYKSKVIQALNLSTTIDDVIFIEQKIVVSQQINRRTNAGRELTEELLELCRERSNLLKDSGALPF